MTQMVPLRPIGLHHRSREGRNRACSVYLERANPLSVHGIHEGTGLRPVWGECSLSPSSFLMSFTISLCPWPAFLFLCLRTCTLDSLWSTPWKRRELLCLPMQRAGGTRELMSCQGSFESMNYWWEVLKAQGHAWSLNTLWLRIHR